MQTIRVRFVRFWKGFEPTTNFLTQLIESVGFVVEIIENKYEICDIEFVSVNSSNLEKVFQASSIIKHRLFGSFHDVQEKYNSLNLPKTKNARRRVWITGENLRPPFSQEFDGFLSFDQNLLDNNAYLPIWYFDAGFFKPHFVQRVGVSISVQELLQGRSIAQVPPKFACMFAGNPHSIRLQFAELLEKVNSVEKFGAAFGNQVRHKFPVGSQFKFTIAFENDSYPGYVTEKILEAYLCGSVPVYWGDLGVDSPINPRAILTKRKNQTLAEFAREISTLGESEILDILNQPLLTAIPQMEDIKNVIFGEKPFYIR